MAKKYKKIVKCRSCGSRELKDILNLGRQSIVGFTIEKKKPILAPLVLTLCNNCKLLQLKHTTKPEFLWNEEYGYRSGVNKTMRNELKDIAQKAEELANLKPSDVVLDIGCNDGTLLDSYETDKIFRFGIDPSHNVVSLAFRTLEKYGEDNFSLTIDFFNKNVYQKSADKKAKIITAIAMFYDLDNPNKFLDDINKIMNDEGIFIIQQNYLVDMLNNNAFDNILHEHLEYYSLTSLINLLKKHSLEVFDVTTNNINGGSFRTFIKKSGSNISSQGGKERVDRMLKKEGQAGLLSAKTYENFAKRVKNIGEKLKNFLKKEVKKGKTVHVYGASTRGNSLLQFYGIDNKLIKAASERNPYKWGKITLGTNIPIISEKESRSLNPDYYLALPWYFRDEFLEREKDFLTSGGKFIFPLPKFEVVGKN